MTDLRDGNELTPVDLTEIRREHDIGSGVGDDELAAAVHYAMGTGRAADIVHGRVEVEAVSDLSQVMGPRDSTDSTRSKNSTDSTDSPGPISLPSAETKAEAEELARFLKKHDIETR